MLSGGQANMVNIGIIGATGYVGIEIIRLLQNHPEVNISTVVSQSFTGKKISDVYPSLRNVIDIECQSLDIDKIAACSDIVITALPHGVSSQVVPEFLKRGRRVIDHSGDFRYRSVEIYEKWYKTKHHSPELLKEAVYGLPELYRDKIKDAAIVANPGCYPTCSILGLAPLLSNRLVDTNNIIIDAASGVTGAGRKSELAYQFCECTENFKAYGVTTHRHTSEIEQELGLLAGTDIMISFTPHLVPMKRGMLATIYANLNTESTAEDLLQVYREFYKDEFFIRVLDNGHFPETKHVSGSNYIDIGLAVDKRLNRVIVLSAIDNLGKGAAGQAVQVLNIMCGFPESTGLTSPAFYL